MLSKIFGFFWFVLGILWLIKPDWLRTRLAKKTSRKITWPVYGVLAFLALNFIGVVIRFEGWWLKLLGLVGIFFLVRTALRIQSEAMSQFREWWSNLPPFIFRLWALFCIGLGVSLLYF